MAFIGMDVDAATGHAQTLQNQGVDAIQSIITALDGLLPQIMDAWKGTDATSFDSDWNSSHKPNLSNIHSALVEFHTKLTQNIQQQTETSAS
jgi:uncharacterized protein YukE